METYKQDIKDKSRKLIWDHAVRSLTQNRTESRILNPNYLDNLWDFVNETFDDERYYQYDSSQLNDFQYEGWKDYADDCYGQKRPSQLKVAFFCGPEPENDVEHLLRLGVRLENMYAFELDKAIFDNAVVNLHDTYPQLKIFNGKIEDFVKLNEVKFDIIYLDFTKSLLQEMRCVFSLLDCNSLSELSVLAVNTSYPDQTEDNINFLAQFFYESSFYEHIAINPPDKYNLDPNKPDNRFVEGSSCYGYTLEDLKEKVTKNYENAYSVFQTRFITLYANIVKPVHEALNNRMLMERMYKDDSTIKAIIKDTKRYNELLQTNSESDIVLLSHLYESLSNLNGKLQHYFRNTTSGASFNHLDCLKLYEMFVNSPYEDFRDILNASLAAQIDDIDKNLIGGRFGMFCDVPLPYLWLELLIYNYGHTYHHNTKNHRRYSYTAKEHKMCIDIFTFDKCRPLYDSMPVVEYLSQDLSDVTRQFINRMCIDAIGKHSLFILEHLYYGSCLIGIGDKPWALNYYFPNRLEI